MKNRVNNNEKKRSASNNRVARETKEKDNQPKDESIKEFHKGSDFINSLVHEYLLKREYLKTLDTFQDEISAKIKNKQYYSTKFMDLMNDTVIEGYFNGGKKNEFFKIWNRLIPSHIKARELILEKLEFFLQIYFAIYPLLPSIIGDKKNIKENNLKETKVRLQEFKSYLESKEVEMSKTTEYLAYYALPYVQNPREHPSYKQIFTNEWVKELKDKLKTCLISYVPTGKYPLLYDMYMTCEVNSIGDNKVIKGRPLYNFLETYNQNYEVIVTSPSANVVTNVSNDNQTSKIQDEYNRLKKKEEAAKLTLIESQKKWTNFSLDLLNISFELISNIKKLQNGNEIPSEYIDSTFNKLHKYEAFLKKNAEELEKNTSFNKERDHLETQENIKDSSNAYEINITKNNKSNNQSLQEISHNKSHINQSIHINYDPNFMLDMQSIKGLLAKINAYGYDTKEFYDQVNFILREIRLRIARRKFAKIKQVSLYAVIFYDLLGLRSKHVKIFSNLISNPNTILETLKLMNAITNENRGRTYMLSKPSLLEEIVKMMIGEELDSEVRQNCLGIVQKFTLRSEPQKKLIELDVISWITNVFVIESGNLSEYTLEYGLAFLMNLSLRCTGRDKCEKVSSKLLKILISYFHSDSIQVRTCINGTLFSLLKRKKIKSEARSLGLEKMLMAQLQDPNEQMKKQIQYILDELNNEVDQEEKSDEEFEDENYGDEEEEAFDDEYYEEDSLNDDLIGLHYQILGQFILRNPNENEHEIQKLVEFINSTNKNASNKNLLSNVSASIRIVENDRPLRRPTTPMTNLSSTSNSQIFNQERRSIASKMKANLKSLNVKVDVNNEQMLDDENIYHNANVNIVPVENKRPVSGLNIQKNKNEEEKKDLDPVEYEIGFIKKDKLARTPPGNSLDRMEKRNSLPETNKSVNKEEDQVGKSTQELFTELDKDPHLFKEMIEEGNVDKKGKKKKKVVPQISEDESDVEKEINKKAKSVKTKKATKDDSTATANSTATLKSTQGRRSNNTKEKTSKPKSKEKIQKKSYTDKEALPIITNFMITQNRPFSVQNVVDNLQGQIKKGQCQKLLDQLVDEEILIMKEYNSKIYLANQTQFEKVDQKDLDDVDKEIEESKQRISELKDVNAQLASELKNLSEEISNEEMERRLLENRKHVSEMEKVLNKIKKSKVEEIPEDKIKEAEKDYENMKNTYKKTRRACLNIMDYLGENIDLTRKQLMDLLCLEDETEMLSKLKIKII